jgi:hypothetical protein
MCYDGAIMMSRTQITLDPEIHRRAGRKAAELGLSFAEYIRRLVARDLEGPSTPVDPSFVFGLGSSAGSDVARHKDTMIGEAAAAEQSRGSRESESLRR